MGGVGGSGDRGVVGAACNGVVGTIGNTKGGSGVGGISCGASCGGCINSMSYGGRCVCGVRGGIRGGGGVLRRLTGFGRRVCEPGLGRFNSLGRAVVLGPRFLPDVEHGFGGGNGIADRFLFGRDLCALHSTSLLTVCDFDIFIDVSALHRYITQMGSQHGNQ